MPLPNTEAFELDPIIPADLRQRASEVAKTFADDDETEAQLRGEIEKAMGFAVGSLLSRISGLEAERNEVRASFSLARKAMEPQLKRLIELEKVLRDVDNDLADGNSIKASWKVRAVVSPLLPSEGI
jgi:hypothetical protein